MVKIRTAATSVIIAAICALPYAHASSIPACANGADPDGDGWGWQDNGTCKVYPTCSSANSDTDKDNWGWENGASCVVYQKCSSDQADTDNDGWGWENNRTCISSTRQSHLANANANQDTKKLYAYLTSLRTKSNRKVLSGAFGGYSGITGPDAFSMKEAEDISAWASGEVPAIYACDYSRGWDLASSPDHLIDYGCNTMLKDFYKNKGGLVQISNHLPNPVSEHGAGLNTAIADWQYGKIFEEGHDIRKRWLAILDKVAKGLADLQDAGVTVIYRPLHEQNGEWFWWGNTGENTNDTQRQKRFKDLYIDMFNYFTYDKGLNNLIWVFSPDANRKHKTAFYPGDEYVDIVALDAYTNSPHHPNVVSGYYELKALGKPFAFGEIGPDNDTIGEYDYQAFINAIKTVYKDTIYYMPWNSKWSPISNNNAWHLFNDDWVVNLDDMP